MNELDVALKTRLTEDQARILYGFVGDMGEVMQLGMMTLDGIDFDVLLTSAKVGVNARQLAAILGSLMNGG